MGKKSSKSKTTTSPWGPAQPYILGAMNTVNGIVQGNQGNLNGIASDIRGQLPTLQSMAFGQNPTLGAANSYAQDVLGGKYLNQGNPYLEGMIGKTANDVGNRVNSTFSMAGRTGGGNNIGRMTSELANSENALRYQDYGAERDRMAQQGALAPSLTEAQYAGVAPWLAASQLAGQLPYAGASALSPLIGMGAGAGTTTSTQPGGWGTALLGGLSNMFSFSPIKLSDRRLKKDIVEVGTHRSGLTEYEWTYRSDPEARRYRGVMADEVKLKRPEAYVENYLDSGFDAVNYGAL